MELLHSRVMVSAKRRISSANSELLLSALPVKLFKALCEPNRVALVIHLGLGGAPMTVATIAEAFSVDMSVVSRHLAVLRDAGVLHAEKRGREVYYSVRVKDLAQTLRSIADALERCCR